MRSYVLGFAAAILVLLAAIGGCSPQTSGYLITPVPADRHLEETVLASDPGLGVDDKIAIVDVDGVLMNSRKGGMFGTADNPMSLFIEKIDKAQCDPDVKAVVVRVNSPGGGVMASDVMYTRLMRMKMTKKIPVVAVIEDVGASGGYYISCAADQIVAHPTSITGSIGVIIQSVNFTGTMKMIGVEAKAITSGKYKDMGSPFKPYDEKDIELFQKIVDEFYGGFLKVVGSSRTKLSADKIKTLADGRVYTGKQALDNGLVDKLGTVEDAIMLAKELAKTPKVKVVIYNRPLGYRANVYSQAPQTATPQVNMLNVDLGQIELTRQPQFLYLWDGKM